MMRRATLLFPFLFLLFVAETSADLVGHYTFDDGTASDESGYLPAADGTLIGGATIIDNPERGKILRLFDLSPSHVNCGYYEKFDCSDAITLAAWIKTANTVAWRSLIRKQDYTWRFSKDGTGTNLYFAGNGLSENYQISGTVNISDGTWHHIAAVYDGNNIIIYVDCKLDVSKNASGSINTSTAPVYIGRDTDSYDPEILIDDIRIYNHALSQNEIKRFAAGEFGKAWGPYPADEAEFVNTNINLSWMPGDNAAWHDVYFGKSFEDVNNAIRLAGDVDGDTNVNVADLSIIFSNWLQDPSGLNPYPDKSGDENVNMTDFALVTRDWLKDSDPIFKGSFDINHYAPNALESNTTYYWRIDEVNGIENYKGDCWNFTTTNGATITGFVTGDISQMPWQNGRSELGWCAVRLYRNGLLQQVTRTNTPAGDFELTGLEPGTVELRISRPGFVSYRQWVNLEPNNLYSFHIFLNRDNDYETIVLPRTGTALTRIPGENFVIECIAPDTANNWKASLATEYFSRSLNIVSSDFAETGVFNNTRDGWLIEVNVPATTPPAMYKLCVEYNDVNNVTHYASQEKAVNILSQYPDRYYVMPYLDFHFNWPGNVDGQGAAGEKQADYFKAASLIQPLYVAIGDDVGFYTYPGDAYAMFHYINTVYCDVPVYLAFGNHDAELTIPGHEYHFGPRWQKRRIGPNNALILSYDLWQGTYDMPQQQKDFVNNALAEFHSDPDNKIILLQGHLHPWQHPEQPYFEYPFTQEQRPWFPGNTCGSASLNFDKLFMYALSFNSMHGWSDLNYSARVIRFNLNTVSSGNLLTQSALPSVEYNGLNNGTEAELTATIRLIGADPWNPPDDLYVGGVFCGLPSVWEGMPGIENARLKFIMQQGQYTCTEGKIIQTVDGDLGTTTSVYVEIDIDQPITQIDVIKQ